MAFASSSDADKRKILVANFFLDEKAYYESVSVLVKTFLLRLQVMSQVGFGVIEQSHILDLFSNIDDVRDVTESVWRDLSTRIERWEHIMKMGPQQVEEATAVIAASLASVASNLSVYSLYVSNYERSQKLLEILRDSNDKFRQFVTVQEICEGSELPILVGFPCIRFQQYQFAVEEIMATYGGDRSKAAELNKARKALEQAISEINDRRNNIDARMRVAYIQEKLFKGEVYIATPTRYFIKSGPLKKVYNKTGFKLKNHQKYMFFLFSDCLVYALRPSATSDTYKFKHAVPTFGMTVQDAPDSDKVSFAFHISGVGNQKSFTVYASEQKEKEEWMAALKETADRATASGSVGGKGGDELENVIEQGRKALSRYAMRVADNWIQVNTDTGVNYFYQLKTGVTSLSLEDGAQVSSQPPSLDQIGEDGLLGASMKPTFCLQPDCGRKAVATLGDGKYCAVHAKDAGEFDEDEKDGFRSSALSDAGPPPPPPDSLSPATSPYGRSTSMAAPSAPKPPMVPSFGGGHDDPPPPPRIGGAPRGAAPPPPAAPAPPPAPSVGAVPPPPAAPAVGTPAPPSVPSIPSAPAIGLPGPPRMGAPGGMPPIGLPGLGPRPPSLAQAGGLQVGFGLPRIGRAPMVASVGGDDDGPAPAPPIGLPRMGGPLPAGRPPMGPASPRSGFSPPPPPPEEDDPPAPPPSLPARPGRPAPPTGGFKPPPPPADDSDVPAAPVLPGRPGRAPIAFKPPAPSLPDDDAPSSPVLPKRPGGPAPPSVPSVPSRPAAPSVPSVPSVPARPAVGRAPAPTPSHNEDETPASPVLPGRKISTAGPRAPSVASPAPAPPKPASPAAAPKWKKVMSEQYKQYYYWCEKTNEVTWVKPPDYDGED
jgi:hypothetical protein